MGYGNVSFPGSWESGTGFSQLRVHTVMVGQAQRARIPVYNCINKWLGEPVSVSQHPGRGILRNFVNILDINNFKNQCIETLI